MFEYKPVDYNKGEVRLLHLAPGRADDIIRGSLVHIILDKQPIYHALSYSCGSSTDMQQILLDDAPFDVGKNLFEAMRALRDDNKELVVWIDAICINQLDVRERSEEIKRMRPIYENAAVVDVWLGPATEDSSFALSIARTIAKGLYSAQQAVGMLQAPDGARSLRALVELFGREYWQRTWVVQEYYLAKKAVVHCGPDSVTQDELKSISGMALQWHAQFSMAFTDDFDEAAKMIEGQNFLPRDHSEAFPETSSHNSSPMSLLTTGGPVALRPAKGGRLYGGSFDRPQLLDCLIWHRSKNATDARDKVYALAGITLGEGLLKSADYELSVKDVYQNTVKYIVETTKSLDVICASRLGPYSSEFPSWTPDWRSYEFKHQIRNLYFSYTKFNASGADSAEASFSSDGSVLTARGFLIDSIEAVCSPCIMEKPENINPVIKAFHEWHNMLVQVKGPGMEHGVTFCNTLLGESKHELFTPVRVAANTIASFLIILQKAVEGYKPSPALFAWEEQLKAPQNARLWQEFSEMYEGHIRSCAERMQGKRFFASSKRAVGLGMSHVEAGDLVCVLLGCSYPVILRQLGDRFCFMGEVYMDGIMLGEAVEWPAEERVMRDFEIY